MYEIILFRRHLKTLLCSTGFIKPSCTVFKYYTHIYISILNILFNLTIDGTVKVEKVFYSSIIYIYYKPGQIILLTVICSALEVEIVKVAAPHWFPEGGEITLACEVQVANADNDYSIAWFIDYIKKLSNTSSGGILILNSRNGMLLLWKEL